MSLQLIKLTGNRASLGSVLAHPSVPGHIVYATGAQVVVSDEAQNGQNLLRDLGTSITAFAVSPLGRFVAAGTSGSAADVCLWDLTTLRLLTRFCEHDAEVVYLKFSCDDRLLLTVGHEERDQKLFVLDTSTGKIVTKTNLEWRKRVTAAAFSPVMKGPVYEFATASDNEIILYTLDPYTGLLSPRKVTAGSVRRAFTSMCFSQDGNWLYAGTTTGDIVTVNVVRAAIQLTHPACGNGVGAMVLSSTGRLLVGGGDGSITLFSNDHMWRDMRPFATVPGAITSLSSTPDGSALIVATAQGAVYRVASGTFAVSLLSQGHRGPVTRVLHAPSDPHTFASAGADGVVALWSTQDFSQLGCATSTPQAGAALSLALSPDLLISGWADGVIRAHARPSQGYGVQGPLRPVWEVPGAHALAHSCGVTAMRLASRGHLVASGGAGGEIRAWDVRTRGMVMHSKHHNAAINDLALLADDAHVLAVSDDRSMSAWDMGAQRCKATWRSAVAMKAVAVAPDQTTLATAGLERAISIWDMRAPEPVQLLHNAHDSEVGSVAISPNGALLASGGYDSAVKLWDMRAVCQRAPQPLLSAGQAHTGRVVSMEFDRQGGRLVSGSDDGTIANWAVA